MKRTYRKLIGLIEIVALLFSQLAVSAYACPLLTQTDREQIVAVSMSVASSDVTDVFQPGLCQKHCENEQQNVNDSVTPMVSVTLAHALVVVLPVLQPSLVSSSPHFPSLLHATSPPIPIRNCCFRI